MAYQPRRFTEEQIERANRVDILEYARSQGLHLKKQGSSYEVLDYKGGFFITPSQNLWYRFNDKEGGGVVKLCMKLENKTWVEAVKTLLNEDMEPIRHRADWKPEPEPLREFHLPNKNDTYRHVFAYLTKTRGIDESIVKTMVDKKLLYENTQRSCVFVGRDKEGVAKHASIRSTYTQGKAFKQDVAGSQKAYSFSITGTSGTLNVFEAPIDALSYMSLQKLYGRDTNDSYLSLGGVEDRALERFLADNKDIEKIRVCTDHDQAGEKAVARIYERFGQDYKVTRHRPTNKDFNADLVAIRQQEQMKQQEKSQNQESAVSNTEQNAKPAEQKSEDNLSGNDIAKKESLIKLQGISGYQKGTPTKDLKIGDVLVWNGGETSKVVGFEPSKTGKTILFQMKNIKDGVVRPRRMKADTLVVVQERAEEQPEQTEIAVNALEGKLREIMLQAGVSSRLIEWYKEKPELCVYENGTMHIEGSSTWLFVCDNPVELFACRDKEERDYMRTHSIDRYESNAHYITYQSAEQIAAYVREHPEICVIGVATSRTPDGEQAFKAIKSKLASHDIVVGRSAPKLSCHTDDIRMENKISAVLEQTSMPELQPDMEVGMEM